MLEVTVNSKEIVASLLKLSKELESNLPLNKELSRDLAQKASSMAPKLTGNLASSIVGTGSENKAQISAGSNAVPYAGVIEYGWPAKDRTAKPYLTPAVNNNLDYIISKYNDSIKENVKKYNLN